MGYGTGHTLVGSLTGTGTANPEPLKGETGYRSADQTAQEYSRNRRQYQGQYGQSSRSIVFVSLA